MRLLFFALFLSTLFFQGCASNEPADREEVSTLPWNRPQRWEGQGALGGMISSQEN
ncbi:MAG: hypothetical protein R3F23_03080 [Verrucomicrobiia bacterium]